jgi:lipopolysaccharide transport system permease protein
MNPLPMLQAVWSYRGFILGNVKREFQSKYNHSILGAAWTVLNPLAMILVYTIIFAEVMRAKLPGSDSSFAYSIYLCAGILHWGLFAEITSRSTNVFLDNANLIKKISFPRICLPVIVLCNAALNFAVIFALFTAFLLLSGNFPGWAFFALIPLWLVLALFSLGLGTILGVLNVFFRDVGQFFTIFVQFWFWFTPIVYTASILPERFRPLLAYNPLAPLIAACQGILVHGAWPNWPSLLPGTLMALALCLLGLVLFRRRAGEMVDEL